MPTSKEHIVEQFETYKDLFDNAHDLIHIVEPDGTIVYVNNAWTNILGYSQNEMKGKSIYAVVYPADLDRFVTYRNSIINGKERKGDVVIRMLTKAGKVIYTQGIVSVKAVKGVTLYTRGIFRDVTERIQYEADLTSALEKLKQREANLHQLLFHAPDAIIVVDTQSIIRFWNPKAEEIFGWTFSEVTGKKLTEVVIPAQYRDAHSAGMKRYLSTGEQHVLNRTIEISALKKDGQEFFVALTISPTFQNDERVFIAFVRDIDQQKRNEKELDRQRTQLELKGRQLEASNSQLEQFAHVASHDMKEPIRKILTFSERLKSDAGNQLSANSHNYLQKIDNSANRLTKMVDGILLYSTLKEEKLVTAKTDLSDIMGDVAVDLELLFQSRHAILRHTNLPVIEAALFLIYQLFYNLISNSLKFSRPDVEPLIEVTAEPFSPTEGTRLGLDRDLPFVRITVSDNGIGFDQQYAEVIFHSFKRLNAKDKFEGTGLGLALCKMIVEKHHGFIEAIGRENYGATFHIILPESQPQPLAEP